MILFLAAAAAVAASPSPGSADFDIRCMLVANQVIEKVDAPTKAKVGPLAMYYFGRVDSRLSGNELQQRVGTIARSMLGQQLKPLLTQCGEFMSQRAGAMQRTGQAITSQIRRSVK